MRETSFGDEEKTKNKFWARGKDEEKTKNNGEGNLSQNKTNVIQIPKKKSNPFYNAKNRHPRPRSWLGTGHFPQNFAEG